MDDTAREQHQGGDGARHEPGSGAAVSRRRFLQGTGAALAGLAAGPGNVSRLLSRAAEAPARGGRSATPLAGKGSSNVPAYVPAKVPPPDLVGSELVPAAYFKLPSKFTEAYPVGKTPAHGGKITVFMNLYAAPPTPLPGNKWWAALDKEVGAYLTPVLVPSGSYPEKQAASIASGQIGDMMSFTNSLPSFVQLLEHDFENLTPYLAGDNIRKYPNLANIPTLNWTNSMINGQIWGLPIPRPIANTCYEYRTDFLAGAGGKLPASGAEFVDLAKELTGKGRWMIGPGSTDGNSPFNYDFFFQMFGVPNHWAEHGGRFTGYVEAPQVEDALNFMVKLNRAGYFYPGGPVSTLQEKSLLQSGKIFFYGDGITGMYANFVAMRALDPKAGIAGMVPPAYNGKEADRIYWNSTGLFGLFTSIAKASKSRVETLLRVADWGAAPFGTSQYMLRNYGLDNVDYTVSNGNVTPTHEGQVEDAGVVFGYLSNPAFTYFTASPGVTAAMHTFAIRATHVGINSAANGLYSATRASADASLTTMIMGAISDIASGRSPVSSWKSLVQQWRSAGGSKIKDELAKAYEDAHR